MAKRVESYRWRFLARLVALSALVITAVLLASTPPASAQWFDGGFGNFWGNSWGQQRRSYRPRRSYQQQQYQHQYYQQRPQQAEIDYSKAPAAKKPQTPPQTNVLVAGDSMADWLGYGLELSFSESPEMGVLRGNRTNSGLIQQEVRSDPRGEHPDWPKLIPELLKTDKPDYVIMMVGANDRRPIREMLPPRAAVIKPPGQPGAEGAQPPAAGNNMTPAQAEAAAATAKKAQEEAAKPTRGALYEFRSEKWVDLYIKRIDETIAAMKKQGVPVFWVGLPPVRSARVSADYSFLNDLFRSRADKAGIVYVDIWDGFVDDSGRFTYYGPDVEGQNRRLRAPDGVHFTEAGARKLAHFVERELQRAMTARPTPVALPVDEPTTTRAPETAAKTPGAPAGIARPLSGPVISLSGVRESEDEDALIGGAKAKPEPAIVDAVASKVLVKGDTVPAPAGRADDFSWPRRDVAPVGADPSVAVATLPMTPMKSEQRRAPQDNAPAAGTPGAPGAPGQPPDGAVKPRVVTRQQPQQSGGWLFGNWGWQQQQQQQQYRQRPQQQYRQRAQQPGFFPFLFRH